MSSKHSGPRILFYDIETAPIAGYVWALWDQNVGVNQIQSDWYVLSWSAKWQHEKTVMYMDQRHARDIEDDKKILKALWVLLDTADIVVTQNGKKFDEKKVNARFAIHGFPPPSPYKHIDTKQIASKRFAFTSNSLEYLSSKLCTKYKKLKHKKYPGFELWSECMKGNQDAWETMEKYNQRDVLALEELYKKLIPWDSSINFSVYYGDQELVCSCGSRSFQRRGYDYTKVGKYQRYKCNDCGSWSRSRLNEFSEERRAALRVGPTK